MNTAPAKSEYKGKNVLFLRARLQNTFDKTQNGIWGNKIPSNWYLLVLTKMRTNLLKNIFAYREDDLRFLRGGM